MVGVAQLVRAPGCGPGGRGFNPHHSPHLHTFTQHVFREQIIQKGVSIFEIKI